MPCGSKAAGAADARNRTQCLRGCTRAIVCRSADSSDGTSRNVRGFDLCQQVIPRTGKEGCCEVIQFVVAGEQVIAKSDIQRKSTGCLPVVLHVSANFKIAPVTDVLGQCWIRILIQAGTRRSTNPGV